MPLTKQNILSNTLLVHNLEEDQTKKSKLFKATIVVVVVTQS